MTSVDAPLFTVDDWGHQIETAVTAERIEQQPNGYQDDDTWFDHYQAGQRTCPPEHAQWLATAIKPLAGQGRRRSRFRIVNDPPTEREQWADWLAEFNRDAGETITTVPRPSLTGLNLPVTRSGQIVLPGFRSVNHDWWLLNNDRVLVLTFDQTGRMIDVVADTTEPVVMTARTVRDELTNLTNRTT